VTGSADEGEQARLIGTRTEEPERSHAEADQLELVSRAGGSIWLDMQSRDLVESDRFGRCVRRYAGQRGGPMNGVARPTQPQALARHEHQVRWTGLL
jgi:hypothetical protein